MGIVINLPIVTVSLTTEFNRVSPNSLTQLQYETVTNIMNNGIHMLWSVPRPTPYVGKTTLAYATTDIGKCALYGSSVNDLSGYCRCGRGHIVVSSYDSADDVWTYNYIAVSDNPYTRIFESNVIYSTPLSSEYLYSNAQEALNALSHLPDFYPISYRLTNCTAPSAPTEATVGDTVEVTPIFPANYGVINPATDAYVMNNGVLIPSTWSNGVLTFTMPDPS